MDHGGEGGVDGEGDGAERHADEEENEEQRMLRLSGWIPDPDAAPPPATTPPTPLSAGVAAGFSESGVPPPPTAWFGSPLPPEAAAGASFDGASPEGTSWTGSSPSFHLPSNRPSITSNDGLGLTKLVSLSRPPRRATGQPRPVFVPTARQVRSPAS